MPLFIWTPDCCFKEGFVILSKFVLIITDFIALIIFKREETVDCLHLSAFVLCPETL